MDLESAAEIWRNHFKGLLKQLRFVAILLKILCQDRIRSIKQFFVQQQSVAFRTAAMLVSLMLLNTIR